MWAWPAGVGALAILVAFVLDRGGASVAVAQTWPAFVLVAGLLMIGMVLSVDGLFGAAAAWLEHLPGPPVALLLACYGLVALVTALLNLDTAVVFLTPVLIKVAARRGMHLAPFLYGTVLMANASSLFLPGSNLTNLLVLAHAGNSGGSYLKNMLAISLTASILTAAGLLLAHRKDLSGGGAVTDQPRPRARYGPGLCGVLSAAAAILLLQKSALPVFAIGVGLVSWRILDGSISARQVVSQLGLPALLGLFGAAVGLGTVARASAFPGRELASAGAPMTALVAALTSVLVNNLPASVLLSSSHNRHPQALLLGLAVGPNLAVTGSLSVLLWWRAARAAGAKPTVLGYSLRGAWLAVLVIPCALAVGALVGSSS